jgi:predicted nucleotidyltransferase
MSNEHQMHIRLRERQALLDNAARLLHDDEHIVAAWLIGSLGRGDSDEWSDIDLWIVVKDDAFDAVTTARYEFSANLGRAVLFEDAPQNAPTGGAFLTAMYAGTGGAHQVDLYWQPMSLASRPPDTRLLFERVNIPLAEQTFPSDDERIESAIEQTRYFWVMSAIVAKTIARRNIWKVLQLLIPTRTALEQVRWLIGERSEPPTYREMPTFNPPQTSADHLGELGGLLEEMSRLVAKTPALRNAVDPAAIEQVRELCSTVERKVI